MVLLPNLEKSVSLSLKPKAKDFVWTDECNAAFAKLKEYLSNPPIMSRPLAGEVLLVYLAASEQAVSAVLVREEQAQQKPVYFLSRRIRDAETRYPPLDKLAYALVIARHV